ncbi:tRNA-uridine aminocarboxypropyltransferase [Neptunomonas sp.]|uniref:tRNA-uridine aminocarboxypropyltransferase n=1 Tax=Neptunomonas sp. TaxID=1971898 RepID=UPI0025EEC012|nr:tRNA-uridine aminocarboxypropyltransferase [Neptunomonas sp.]
MHIILLTHERELQKKTNTGQLVEALSGLNVTRITWKRTSPDPLLLRWIKEGNVGLLYPAKELSDENALDDSPEACDLNLHLNPEKAALLSKYILIDSTWQEARKIFNRSVYLRMLPRVTLIPTEVSIFTLRRNQVEGGLCTAESVIALLRMKKHNLLANKLETDFHAFIGRVVDSST